MKDYNILMFFCRTLYYLGFGEVWFEPGKIGNENSTKYKIYAYTLRSLSCFLEILEIGAACFGEFPTELKTDSITLAFTHSSDITKVIIFLSTKERYIELLRDIVACDCYETQANMKLKYRTIRTTTTVYVSQLVICILCYNAHAIDRALSGETKYVAQLLYYPKYESSGPITLTFRLIESFFGSTLPFIYIGMCNLLMCLVIMVRYKFTNLKEYFLALNEIRKEDGSIDEVEFKNRFVEGIVMHQRVLRITKNLESLLSPIISVYLYQSYVTTISVLFFLMASDSKDLANLLRSLMLIASVLFLMALCLCNAGEITNQASALSEGIFYSGWHAIGAQGGRTLRGLILPPLLICSKPLVLKTANIYELSYSSFISLLQGIYSVVTLVFARSSGT